MSWASATVADLAGVDPRKLAEAGAALSPRMREYVHRWGPVALTPTPLSPVVDGEVLPAAPWEALASGAARGIELIAGHNQDEYRLFLLLGGLLGGLDDDLASMALGLFGPTPDAGKAYRAAFTKTATEFSACTASTSRHYPAHLHARSSNCELVSRPRRTPPQINLDSYS